MSTQTTETTVTQKLAKLTEAITYADEIIRHATILKNQLSCTYDMTKYSSPSTDVVANNIATNMNATMLEISVSNAALHEVLK